MALYTGSLPSDPSFLLFPALVLGATKKAPGLSQVASRATDAYSNWIKTGSNHKTSFHPMVGTSETRKMMFIGQGESKLKKDEADLNRISLH